MKYELDEKLTEQAREIAIALDFTHVNLERLHCIKSYGSKSRRTIARLHGMGKVIQLALGINSAYVIEFLSEQFDKESEKEQIKTIIHELMHIPANFGGGFRHHKKHVTEAKVNQNYEKYLEVIEEQQRLIDF